MTFAVLETPRIGGDLFQQVTLVWLLLALPIGVALCFINAPYGRHATKLGPTIPARAGWFVMESPSVLVMTGLFVVGDAWHSSVLIVFLLVWLAHYINRAWVYPFQLSRDSTPLPLLIMSLGVAFNCINATLNGAWLFLERPAPGMDWLYGGPFIVGSILFFVGMGINLDSNHRLIRLKKNAGGYAIPTGGLFRWISCPNYLGEIIEWIGWAILTWSPPGMAFAVWTTANLVPRARAHHEWYQARFPGWAEERRALVPGLY